MIGVESLLECIAPALAMIRQNMSQNIIPLSVSPCVLVLLSNIAINTLSCELLLHKGIRVRGKTLDRSLKEGDTFIPYQFI